VIRREDFPDDLPAVAGIAMGLIAGAVPSPDGRVDEKVGQPGGCSDCERPGGAAAARSRSTRRVDKITRRLTHHTIAQMIGSRAETVSRTMRELVTRATSRSAVARS